MSYSSAFSAFMSKFNTEWAGTLPVSWPNVQFDATECPDGWVSINVLDGESRQASIGGASNVFRHSGVVMIQIFAPADGGANDIYNHVDTVSAIFRNKVFEGIHTGSPSVQQVGIDSDTGKYQINVSIPFYRDGLF